MRDYIGAIYLRCNSCSRLNFIFMQESPQDTPKSTFQNIKRGAIIFIVIALVAFFATFFIGSQTVHTDTNHLLYDAFAHSPPHNQLLQAVAKRKLSIIHGRREDGLFQFAEHYANMLSLQGHNIFIEDISKTGFKLYRIAKAARARLDDWLGIQNEEGDWFIYSKDGTIVPEGIINKIRQGNPKSKIIIVTTSLRQRNQGFRRFQFPEIDQHQIEEAIERNFQVNQNTADILYDYFQTPENVFYGMNFETFSQQQFLGENYRSLEGLSKQENRILKDLCKKGQGDSAKESAMLTQLGVFYYKGENYWRDAEARLNYELHKGLNCKNKLIPEDILRELEQLAQIQAEEERLKEQKAKHKKKQKK